jgi:uncharacterized protein (TIGR02453 family)
MLNKFTEQTNDYLIGIRLNNYKEWFHAHKELYRLSVHEPMVELASLVYERMHSMDKDFVQTPKISRANRDIRFSKNKNPYKECKWFFLRADGKPDLTYSKPTYFFEISPDWWRYGLFFYPKPSDMQLYRNKLDAESVRFERIVNKLQRDKTFALTGESYKRPFKNDLPDKLQPWYQFKGFDLIRTEEYSNTEFYGNNLPDIVFDGFKKLYDIYRFLYEVTY